MFHFDLCYLSVLLFLKVLVKWCHNNEKVVSYRLSIFPNPASTDAKILFDNETERNISIKLTDVLGKTVKEIYANKLSKGVHEFDVNLSDFDKGLYFLSVSSNNQNLTTKKLILK